MSAIEHPELHNLDQIDERLRRAVVNARTMHGIEGLKRFDAETYEHALQLARSIIKESREARAEAIYWTENVMGNITRLRDAARAEVERLTNELNAALNQIDRGAFPDWTCAECGSQAGFDEVRYEAGDADMACRTCGGTDVRESAREAAGALGDKYDALRAAPPVYLTDIDKSVGAISGIVGVSNAAAVRECITKHTRPLDQTSPAVCAVDVEAAVEEWGDWKDALTAVLRNHTRAVSVESVAQALYESAAPRTVHDWPLASGVTKETYIVQARAALRVIGARLAENTGTGAPVPTQHPENQHGYGIRRHVRSADERQAADGSGNRSEDRIPRADSAGVVGGEGVPTPGIEPGEAARGPQGDGSRPALDCHRADALPGGPDGCGSRGDATGVLLTRVAALESALRLETDLRVHGDAVIGARLNLLIKAAPDVGAGLAQPVEPKPPEPAKVRVKLPPRKIPEDYFGIAQLCARAHNDGINACAALLREHGVEVDDE